MLTGETKIDALIRETKEETGLTIIKNTIKPFGQVHRCQKSDQNDYEQDNYYYICDVENENLCRRLDAYDAYDAYDQFTLDAIDYKLAIDINLNRNHKKPV